MAVESILQEYKCISSFITKGEDLDLSGCQTV